jgi:hypothetical protein
MFIGTYLRPLLRAFFAGCIITAGIFTFGQGELFDRLFFTVLVVLFILAIQAKDIDLIGVLIILLLSNSVDELFYLLPDILSIKIIVYAICLFGLYKNKKDKWTIRLAAPLLGISLLAEAYWAIIAYDAPQIYYYNALITINLFVRRFVFLRLFLTPKWFGKETSSISLDYNIYTIAKWSILSLALLTLEYAIRHTTHSSPLFFYYVHQYIAQLLSVLVLVLLIDYTYKQRFVIAA